MNATTTPANSTFIGSRPLGLSSSPKRISLICIYMLIFVIGTLGVAKMINVLKSNLRSFTTIAVVNLILSHVIFLPTIPFRIYYYVTDRWGLPQGLCKMVSSMIHIHMYLSFVIYVSMLILRFCMFYKRMESPEFHRKLHSLGASAAVWAVVLIAGPLLLFFTYGHRKDNGDNHACFNFGSATEETIVRVINYLISIVFITVPIVLCAVQTRILMSITRHYGASSAQQQEFWAQIKSLSVVLIPFVCFVPYHIFRMHYLTYRMSNPSLESQNEIFLATTGLSCIDLLTFGHCACHLCGRTYIL